MKKWLMVVTTFALSCLGSYGALGADYETFVTDSGNNGSLPALNRVFTAIPFDTVNYDDANGFALSDNTHIKAPTWATWVNCTGHLGFDYQTTAGATAGVARIHLFRNDQPTLQDAFYHVIQYYPVASASDCSLGQAPCNPWQLSMTATTNWIPILSSGEKWSVLGWQNTGRTANIIRGKEVWLLCRFR